MTQRQYEQFIEQKELAERWCLYSEHGQITKVPFSPINYVVLMIFCEGAEYKYYF